MSSLTATSFLTDTKVASACAGKRVTICVPNEQKEALQSVEVLIKATGATEINKVYAVPDGNKTEVLIVLGAGFDTTVAAGCLVPDGTLLIHTEIDVSLDMMIAGLVDVESVKTNSGVSLWSGRQPQWEAGSKASLGKDTTSATVDVSAASDAGDKSASVWQAAVAAQLGGDVMDIELEDEDVLLELAGEVAKPPTQVDGGCATKKRACANCSCGRREMEEAEEAGLPRPKVTDEELAKMKSSCGNCHKGDAFRCAGCPFLGKPAYDSSEVPLASTSTDGAVKLDSFVDAGAVKVSKAATSKTTTSGRVMMDMGGDDF
jgi:hypothetical protein